MILGSFNCFAAAQAAKRQQDEVDAREIQHHAREVMQDRDSMMGRDRPHYTVVSTSYDDDDFYAPQGRRRFNSNRGDSDEI